MRPCLMLCDTPLRLNCAQVLAKLASHMVALKTAQRRRARVTIPWQACCTAFAKRRRGSTRRPGVEPRWGPRTPARRLHLQSG